MVDGPREGGERSRGSLRTARIGHAATLPGGSFRAGMGDGHLLDLSLGAGAVVDERLLAGAEGPGWRLLAQNRLLIGSRRRARENEENRKRQ
jgi:hypothetical protein